MKDFIKDYVEEFKVAKTRKDEIEKQIAALETVLNNIKIPNWFIIIEQISNKLASISGIPCIASGPRGIRGECHLFLGEGPYYPQYSITLTPQMEDDNIAFYYDTGETCTKFKSNTLGAANGMNNVTAPCPETVEELWEIIKAIN